MSASCSAIARDVVSLGPIAVSSCGTPSRAWSTIEMLRRAVRLRSRRTVRQRLHARVHEEYAVSSDPTRGPRRGNLTHEPRDERLELRIRRGRTIACVVRGAHQRAPAPRNDEEPPHPSLFARRDRERRRDALVAVQHQVERDSASSASRSQRAPADCPRRPPRRRRPHSRSSRRAPRIARRRDDRRPRLRPACRRRATPPSPRRSSR